MTLYYIIYKLTYNKTVLLQIWKYQFPQDPSCKWSFFRTFPSQNKLTSCLHHSSSMDNTDKAASTGNYSNLYLGDDPFESRSVHRLSWQVSRGFPKSLQANDGTEPRIGPRPLPFTSSPIHYPLIILQFHAMKSDSIAKQTKNKD
jgi:hypothetical protein